MNSTAIGLASVIAMMATATAQGAFRLEFAITGLTGGDPNGSGYDTEPENQAWNIYPYEYGQPLNGGNDATNLDLHLSPGIHFLTLHTAAAWAEGASFALSIFADGNADAPVITAASQMQIDGGTNYPINPFGGMVGSFDFSSTVPGANMLSWTSADGAELVELMGFDFYIAKSGIDLVGGFDSIPDHVPDHVGMLTLRVTTIPAPATLAAAGLALIAHRKR